MPYTIMPPGQADLPSLETERLLLRAPLAEDVDAIDRACQEAEIQRWTVVPSPYRREDAEFFVHRLAPDGLRTGTSAIWCVLEKETGTLVGTQALTTRGPGAAEVGFWTTAQSRGRGYTVEAVLGVARWAFAQCQVRRLEWVGYVGNEPSLAVARRAGFTIEGTLRSYAEQRGVYRDALIGSMLAADLAP